MVNYWNPPGRNVDPKVNHWGKSWILVSFKRICASVFIGVTLQFHFAIGVDIWKCPSRFPISY